MNNSYSESNNHPFAIYALTVAVFAILFLFHIYPLGLGDVYWHLNTGRWIWEHGALQQSDPFTYTANATDDSPQGLVSNEYWQHVTLQGFWLAQLFFYGVYAMFGLWGLVVCKALLFLAIYGLVFRTLLAERVQPLLALLIILAFPLLLYRFDELRPQVFSFLGVVLVYSTMNRALKQIHAGTTRPGILLILPLIMFLWANCHPGFILGWIIIVAMLGGFLIDAWRAGVKPDQSVLRYLITLGVTALLASMINPLAGILFRYAGVIRSQFGFGVDEFLPLFNYARIYGHPFLFYGVLALVLVTAAAVVMRWKHVGSARLFLFAGFAVAGFYAFRYMIFSVLVVTMIGIPHVSALLEPYLVRVRPLMMALTLLATSATGYLVYQRGGWNMGPEETRYVPTSAADWILAKHPPAPLFNAYEYGGYLGWRLTPDYKVFVDPRCLDIKVQNAYQTARGGFYGDVFEKYRVNTVVFYLFTPVVNSIPEITLYLLMDNHWDLVYADRISVVMVRHDSNTMPVLDKTPLLNYLQSTLERTLSRTPRDTQALVQYGRVLLYRGDVTGAVQRFRQALEIDPQAQAPRIYLDALSRRK